MTAVEYTGMCTTFGVDSWSHFPLRAWKHTQTYTYTEKQLPLSPYPTSRLHWYSIYCLL